MLIKTHSLPFPFLFSLSKRWHHGCSSVILTERSEWRDLPCSLSFHRKRGMEKRSCYRKRIRCLFHSSFLSNAVTSSGSRGTCCFSPSLPERGMEKRSCYRKTHSLPFPFLFSVQRCHLERQSRGLLAEADSSTPVLRTFARNDTIPLGIIRKISNSAKTVGKRNSFPGFSFFECFSVAFFLFLSCGDADVSSVVLVWFIFLCIFAYE